MYASTAKPFLVHYDANHTNDGVLIRYTCWDRCCAQHHILLSSATPHTRNSIQQHLNPKHYGRHPRLLANLASKGETIGWITMQCVELNLPIVQLLLHPFGKPLTVLSDHREMEDILVRRSREFDWYNAFKEMQIASVWRVSEKAERPFYCMCGCLPSSWRSCRYARCPIVALNRLYLHTPPHRRCSNRLTYADAVAWLWMDLVPIVVRLRLSHE